MKRFFAMLCVSLSLGAVSSAVAASPEEKVDPIDKAATECLNSPAGQTTAGMVDCSHKAFLAYDKQLNAVYKKVLASVDPESAKQIRDAQRTWVAWREAWQHAGASSPLTCQSDISGAQLSHYLVHRPGRFGAYCTQCQPIQKILLFDARRWITPANHDCSPCLICGEVHG